MTGELRMTMQELDRFCDDWFRGLAARDTEAVLALTTEDVVWDDTVFWPSVVHGRDELRTYLDTVWRTTPRYSVEELDRYYSRDATGAVVLWRQTGTGPERLAAGVPFSFEGCDVFRAFRDGRLSHYYQAGYEIVDMCRQLGLITPRNGLLGAAYLMSLRR